MRARYNPFGGAERFAVRAMEALASRNLAVTIIARSWKAHRPSDEGLAFLRCDPFYLGSTWRDRSFARAVRKLLQDQQFDLVQSHERIPGLAIYRAGDGVHAAWLARRLVHAGFWKRLAIRFNLHHGYLLRTERALFEHPDLRAVICNSTLVRDEISAYFRVDLQKLVVIPNGVDLTYFTAAAGEAHRPLVRAKFGITAQATVFIFAGSGFERKGLADTLRAFARIDAQSHLLIVGDDKHRARYQSLARSLGIFHRTHFVGEVSDLLPYYAAADVLVLPSVYDPFPNVVLEALACGVPVITSDGCGAKDVISEDQNGWIVKSGDEVALSRLMQHAARGMSDSHRAQSLRQAARASVEAYGNDTLGVALIDLYARLGFGVPTPDARGDT